MPLAFVRLEGLYSKKRRKEADFAKSLNIVRFISKSPKNRCSDKREIFFAEIRPELSAKYSKIKRGTPKTHRESPRVDANKN